MISHRRSQKLEIDLHGPDGNFWAIAGIVRGIMKQLGADNNKLKFISKQMISSDYYHALTVANYYIGDYVCWITDEPSYIDALERADTYIPPTDVIVLLHETKKQLNPNAILRML